MRFPARLLLCLSLIVFLFLGIFPLKPVFADSSFYSPTLSNQINPQTDQHVWVQSVMLDVTSAVICQLIGIDPVTVNHQCYGSTDTSQPAKVGGIVGLSTNYISALYLQPATTGQYVNYLANNFGFIDHAFAQGIPNATGFTALGPVLQLWNFTKNLSYLLLTLVFLLIGLGIMLRVKLDPRTVISLQNQIPKVIVGILLITFSYAIVGLLIDVMWATTYFGINLIASQSSDPLTIQRSTESLYNNPLTYVSSIFVKPKNSLQQLYTLIKQETGTLTRDVGQLPPNVANSAPGVATQKVINDITSSINTLPCTAMSMPHVLLIFCLLK